MRDFSSNVSVNTGMRMCAFSCRFTVFDVDPNLMQKIWFLSMPRQTVERLVSMLRHRCDYGEK